MLSKLVFLTTTGIFNGHYVGVAMIFALRSIKVLHFWNVFVKSNIFFTSGLKVWYIIYPDYPITV